MNMKERRKEMKMSLDDIAEATKISKGNLSKFENGKGNPTIGTLKKIAKALKTELIILFK
jgi:transcriptional regulator with XRE-family HTH domain